MRTALLFVFVFFTAPVFCQNADSLAVVRKVDSLIQASRTLTGQREFEKALEVNAAAEKLALEKLGRETAAYGSTCFNHGRVLYLKGDDPETEKWYLESKAIRERTVGKEHPDYAWSLNNLAILYMKSGSYEKAEPLYFESKAIREKALGKEHPDYAGSLNNLANLYRDMGSYEKAEPLYLELKAIQEKTLGKESLRYANTLGSLGLLYRNKGDYIQAEPLYLETKRIQEKVLGKEDAAYANTLNNLAALYMEIDDYAKSEPLYLEAIKIHAKAIGKENESYATFLRNLANLYITKGDYAKAEPLYFEAMKIMAKVVGKEHPGYATPLSGLGNVYREKRDYAKAEPLLLEAMKIKAKTLSKEHPDYLPSLLSLAVFYKEKGDYAKAEPLFLESQELAKKLYGEGTFAYAESLEKVVSIYIEKGEYVQAESLLFTTKEIYEKTLRNESPNYVDLLNDLVILFLVTNRIKESSPIFLQINERICSLIEKLATYSSESQVLAYLQTFNRNIALFQSFAQAYPSPEINSAAFDNALFLKGFLLENAYRLARSVAGADSLTSDTYKHWQGCQRRLATEYAMPIAERSYVAEVEAEAEGYEKTLTRNLAAFSSARRVPHWQDVRDNLRPSEAAVEFIKYRYYTPRVTDSTMYAALLLRPDDAQPRFIPLFEEKSLDSLLQTSSERRADYVNNLYAHANRSATPLGKPQKTLYDLLWKPLEKELAGVNTIYFSPSGLLHRLNLAAIPIGLDSVLADRYHLVELGSTRQLVTPATVNPAANDAVLFGGISYDSDSTAMSQANATLDSISIASRGELSFAYTDSTLRVGTWSALPYTDREVGSVEKTLKSAGFQSDTRRGFTATEEAFKTLGAGGKASPRVLHLATHGFFFPDPKSTSARFETSPTFGATEPVFKISDHPMIRSGLLLAGANYAWATGKPLREGMEDGILTAYEISQMNLSNTELVVLSACETGLGDIQGNEGVYGLQRSFKIAGAKCLIMSLWKVDDQATMKFMEVFYRKWLESKMTIPEAFRATQAEMRERWTGQPYLWAGFVLVE